jgi:hypothetical protein
MVVSLHFLYSLRMVMAGSMPAARSAGVTLLAMVIVSATPPAIKYTDGSAADKPKSSDACHAQYHSLLQKHPEDGQRCGAKGDAHADFLRARLHGVGEQAVDADGGQQECHARKQAKHDQLIAA